MLASLIGCTDVADMLPFSDANAVQHSVVARPAYDKDAACERVAEQRAHDAGYMLDKDDISNLRRKVYDGAYADCVAWKKNHTS